MIKSLDDVPYDHEGRKRELIGNIETCKKEVDKSLEAEDPCELNKTTGLMFGFLQIIVSEYPQIVNDEFTEGIRLRLFEAHHSTARSVAAGNIDALKYFKTIGHRIDLYNRFYKNKAA